MPELRSPLAAHAVPGIFGPATDGNPPLTLSETTPGAIAQVAGWRDFEAAAAPALLHLGFDGLGDYRTARVSGSATSFRIAPDKLLLRHTDGASLQAALATLDAARAPVGDLSHARWLIRVAGPAAADLMARLAPIDFSITGFAAGGFVQTGIHHVAVLIHRILPETFEIYVPVTWAVSLWDLICEAALPFGYLVEAGA